MPSSFDLKPLPVLRAAAEPLQVCRLSVAGQPTASRGVLVVRRGDGEHTIPLDLPAGESEHEIVLPEAATLGKATVELRAGDDQQTIEVDFAPVRRWQVFLVNHSHTDIGFTHTPSDVVEVHVKNLERALELVEATRDWPEEARYRWTVEAAWQVQHFLRARPDQRERLARAVRAGLVEIEALYIHSYFDLLSREQLVRELYFAQELRETLDVPITSAMICDVPGCAWSLVDLMAGAGVRYLGMAPNNFLAPFHAFTDLQRPFVWRGPAGGRVLVWYTDDPYWAYIEGAKHGFWSGIEEVERKLPEKLAQLERDGYPFDAVQIQTGSDNRPLRLLPAAIAREWNRRYLSPRLRVATPSDFFRHAEIHWADRLRVVGGEWQSSWSQTSLHYPKEAAASRRNHATLDLWERLAVVADWIDEAFVYPRAELSAAYDASLLFDEHSGPKGIWRPRSAEQAAEALRQGYALFEGATVPAARGLAGALAAATGVLTGGDEPAVVVWNALSWPRGGEVALEVPAESVGATTRVIDDESGKAVPAEFGPDNEGRRRCVFRAGDVPAIGYRRYRLSAAPADESTSPLPEATADVSGDGARLSVGTLSLVLDAAGQIVSLVDARSGAELVDRAAWGGLNALVRYLPEPHGPEPGGSFTDATNLYEGIPVEGHVVEPETVETRPLAAERVLGGAVARAEATIDGTYRRTVEVRLTGDRVEVVNRLEWLTRPRAPEMLFALFPFALTKPAIRHAAQYAIVDPQEQTLSGSSLDSFAIQHWLDLSAGGRGITLASADLPLVDYGGINLQRFLRRLDVPTGVLAFRAASARAMPPEADNPFGADATLEMRFAMRPYVGPFDPLAATRFGEEQALPLLPTWLPARNPGEWRGATGSFVSLRGESVMLTGLKRAERGDGYVVRLWESAGRRSLAHLSFPRHELVGAWRQTPAEGDLGRLDLADNGVRLELGPFEVATLRFVLGR